MAKAPVTRGRPRKNQEAQENAELQIIDMGSSGQGGSQDVRRVLEIENQRGASGESTDSEVEKIRRRLNNQKKKQVVRSVERDDGEADNESEEERVRKRRKKREKQEREREKEIEREEDRRLELDLAKKKGRKKSRKRSSFPG